MDVRQYLRCKAAYDQSPDENESRALDPWRDSEVLEMVKRHTREIVMGRTGGRGRGDQRR